MPGNTTLRLKVTDGIQRLGTYAYTSGGSVDSDPVQLVSPGGNVEHVPGSKGLTLFITPEDASTAYVYSKDSQGAWALIQTETDIAAAERRSLVINVPGDAWYVNVLNTDASAGNVVIDVRENC